MQVAVDAAELSAGFEHSCGAPAQRHLAVTPAFDVLGVFTLQIPIIDSMRWCCATSGPLGWVVCRGAAR